MRELKSGKAMLMATNPKRSGPGLATAPLPYHKYVKVVSILQRLKKVGEVNEPC